MKKTIGWVLGCREALERLIELTDKVTARVGLRIAKFAKVVSAEMETAGKAQLELFKKYGQPGEKEGTMRVPLPGEPGHDPEKYKAFLAEADELSAEEVEIDAKPIELPPEAEGVPASMLLTLADFVSVKGEDSLLLEPGEKSGPTEVVPEDEDK